MLGIRVDVFVGKIDAAVETDIPVDDRDFTMIAVVMGNGQMGGKPVEHDRLDPHRFQLLIVMIRQRHDAA